MPTTICFRIHPRVELRAHFRIARVDVDHVPRFRVDEPDHADVRQHTLTRILERHGNHVVALRKHLDGPLDVRAEEVRYEKDDRFVCEHLVQILRRATDVRSATHRFERQDVPNQPQRVPSSLPGRNDVLDALCEHQSANAVVVPNRRHREHCR